MRKGGGSPPCSISGSDSPGSGSPRTTDMLRLAAVVAALAVASAAPCRAQASRVACATCHVGNDGGPLTETRRDARVVAGELVVDAVRAPAVIATRFSSA